MRNTRYPFLLFCVAGGLFTLLMMSCGKNSLGPGEQPGIPQGVRITQIGDGQISLAWDGQKEGVDGYVIYRSEGVDIDNMGPYVRIGTTGATTYQDRTLEYEIEYRYRISAFAGDLESELSEVIGGQPLNLLSPRRIGNLSAYARNIPQLNHLDISLVWDANSEDADLWGYRIYRDSTRTFVPDASTFIDSVLSATAFIDQSIDANVEYTFQVVAEDRGGKRSEPVSISVVVFNTPQLTTPVPDELVTTSQVQLRWQETSLHRPTGYVVYLSRSPVFSDSDRFTTDDLSLVRSTNGLSEGRYYWQVGSYTGTADRIVALSTPSSFLVRK